MSKQVPDNQGDFLEIEFSDLNDVGVKKVLDFYGYTEFCELPIGPICILDKGDTEEWI